MMMMMMMKFADDDDDGDDDNDDGGVKNADADNYHRIIGPQGPEVPGTLACAIVGRPIC